MFSKEFLDRVGEIENRALVRSGQMEYTNAQRGAIGLLAELCEAIREEAERQNAAK